MQSLIQSSRDAFHRAEAFRTNVQAYSTPGALILVDHMDLLLPASYRLDGTLSKTDQASLALIRQDTVVP